MPWATFGARTRWGPQNPQNRTVQIENRTQKKRGSKPNGWVVKWSTFPEPVFLFSGQLVNQVLGLHPGAEARKREARLIVDQNVIPWTTRNPMDDVFLTVFEKSETSRVDSPWPVNTITRFFGYQKPY